ncbi:MAG: glycosyltransferase family 2 protein [Candidatus Lindowbacteria bacterium]|nr:glycosyltransferase family 2 protein [Candidatus Lindowbacteria bacterium]
MAREMTPPYPQHGKTLIVIPAFNEEDNIANVIEEIRSVLPDSGIAVINDGSSDGTTRCAEQSGATVLSHSFNLGYGAALQTGYKYAQQKGYDILVQVDADGQHDPSYIPELIRPVAENRCDVAIGSRFLGHGHYEMPLARKCGSLIFRWITSFLIQQRITDPTSGFRAIGRKAFAFCTRDVYPSDFPDADVLVMLKKAGLSVMEVPVKMRPSLSNRTMHSGLNAVYYVFKMFLSIFVTVFREIL